MSKVLRLLLIFLLLESAYGIVCYRCESLAAKGSGRSARTARQAKGGAETKGAGEPRKVKIPECIVDGKDVEKNWEKVECPSKVIACYNAKGTIAKTGSLFSLTKRDCFITGSEYLLNATHTLDQRTTSEYKTENGQLKGEAKITVCDDLNGGEMLCNRGVGMTGMVNYCTAFLSLLILILHYGV